jgi:hypothetical protein
MRAGTARLVVEHLRNGKSSRDAAQAAVEDLSSLQGGVLRTLVIHAIDREGDAYVLALNAEKPVHYCYWHEDLPKRECRKAERIDITPTQLRSKGAPQLKPR